MGYAINLKFGMVVTTNKRYKKIMLNLREIRSYFDELYLRNGKKFFKSVLTF